MCLLVSDDNLDSPMHSPRDGRVSLVSEDNLGGTVPCTPPSRDDSKSVFGIGYQRHSTIQGMEEWDCVGYCPAHGCTV